MGERLRRIVVGGTPSTWDLAVPMGAVLAAVLFAAVFARGSVLDDMPVVTPLGDLLIIVHALLQGVLTAAPLAMVVLQLALLPRPPALRSSVWILSGVAVMGFAGAVGPRLLRVAVGATPGFSITWSEDTWTMWDVVEAAITSVPPGGDPGAAGRGAAWLIARSAMPWALFLAAWLGSWPLTRVRPVHVGWPLTLLATAMALGTNIARFRLVPAEASLPTRLALTALAGIAVPLSTWCVASLAARRWPMHEATTARPRILRLALATCVAAIASVVAWTGYIGTGGLRASLREPPRVGALAPDFTLVDAGGERVTLSQLRGRPVLVAFWASWCGPCRGEFPHLGEIAESGDVAVLAISRDSDRAAMDAYLATQERTPRVLIDDGSAARAYDVNGIPVTWLLDPNGRVLWRRIGFSEQRAGDLLDAVRAARQ